MGTTPVNPFNEADVKEYLETKAAKEAGPGGPGLVTDTAAATDPGALAQGFMDTVARMETKDAVHALLVVSRGLEDLAKGLEEANAAYGDQLDVAAVYRAAVMGRAVKDAGARLYDSARSVLWSLCGSKPGQHDLGGGVKFKFSPLIPVTRSIKYAELQKRYPDVYKELVKETVNDTTKPGRLYLQ